MQFNSVLFPAPESCYKYRRIENIVYIPNPPAEKAPAPEPQKVGSADTGALPPKEVHQESPTEIREEEEEKKPSDEKKVEDESKKTEADEPKENPENTCEAYIPCLYMPNPHGSDKILVFFHGNAEDIGWAYDFVNDLKKSLGVHVLAVEYPGYSLYIGTPNADRICQDAEVVYDYLTQKVGIKEKNIILFGRSIGSGPATHLAARRNPSSLVLMSAYTSIGAVVKNIAGAIGKWFVAERFKNIEEITKIRCPVLFIHGMMDKLIPKSHAEQLLHACVQTISHVKLSEKMTHNDFDMEEDVTNPLIEFLSRCGIKVDNNGPIYEFPDELYIQPRVWKDKSNKPTLVQKLYDKFFQ